MVRIALWVLLAFDTTESAAYCGGNFSIHTLSRIFIKSPNYPNNYPDSITCQWLVIAPLNSKIKVNFDDFQTENDATCKFDYLEIRDGHSMSSASLGKHCGSLTPPSMTSSAEKILLYFRTDGGTTTRGFSLFLETACPDGHFECDWIENCIPKTKLCDGIKDCVTGVDEENCTSCEMADLRIPHANFNNCSEEIDVPQGQEVNVTCRKGYSPLPKSSSPKCINGNWSNIPSCEPSCSTPSHLPANVQIIGSDNVNYFKDENIFLKCLDGYFLYNDLISSVLVITCKGKDVWAPSKFHCFPKEHVHYFYKPYSYTVVEVDVGDRLTVECSLTTTMMLSHEQVGLTFVWFYNGADIKTLSHINFTVNVEGSLILQNIDKESEGSYTCVIKEEFQYVPSLQQTYIVKVGTVAQKCLPSPKMPSITAHQNTSVIMFCPHVQSEFADPPSWFNKYGERIFNDERFSMISSFGLLLKSVYYSDHGSYICDLGPNSPFCDRQFETNVRVIPTTADTCGLAAKQDQFPWLVTLWWNDETAPFCYGTLVNEQWVLTTAFCLVGLHRKRNPGAFVKFGTQNSFDSVENGTTIPVEFAKIHPRQINMADIGVVKLKNPITYHDDIIPICVSDINFEALAKESKCDSPAPIKGNVSGLGSLEADLLHPGSVCMEVSFTGSCPTTPEGVSCARGCDSVAKYVGDTGSPFQVLHNGKMYLYGIFSWGERRAKVTNFDYFTTVFPYYKWISS